MKQKCHTNCYIKILQNFLMISCLLSFKIGGIMKITIHVKTCEAHSQY